VNRETIFGGILVLFTVHYCLVNDSPAQLVDNGHPTVTCHAKSPFYLINKSGYCGQYPSVEGTGLQF